MSDSILGSFEPEGIEIGRTFDGRRVRTNKDHLQIFGGTGTGKGVGILLTTLLSMQGSRSVFVIDPAGELAAVTAEWRRKVSRVVILNPFGVLTQYFGDLQGSCFAPLASLDPESDNFDKDAALLGEALVTVNPDSKEPHWDESARALVTAIIMYVVLIARKHGQLPTMARVRELLASASEPPSKEHPEGKGIPKLARVMMRAGRPGLRNLAAQFTEWHGEIKSIRSNALRQTKGFDIPQIARSMEQNDFDFADFKRTPTTVYLIIPPDEMSEHAKYLRLVLTSAIRASMRPREEGEPSILFMLDEIAALNHLRIVEEVWPQVRKYSIQFMAVWQDLLQLQDIYKKRWGSFLANTGAALFFRPNDMTTAEWLSKRLGETTRMLETMNESENESGGQNNGKSVSPTGESLSGGASKGWGRSRSFNKSPVKVSLTLPHELFGLQNGEMRVFLSGVKDGLTLEAVPYYKIEKLDLRARDNPYVHHVPRRQALPPSSERRGSVPPVDDGATNENVFDQLFGSRSQRKPSPAPWGQLPPPPARRGLPPPHDLRDWDDIENDRF